MKTFYVYLMAGKFRTLYTGVTNNLERRVLEHKRKLVPGFTSKYNINHLVYYKTFGDIRDAIKREKQIKGRMAPSEESGLDRRGESYMEGFKSRLVRPGIIRGFFASLRSLRMTGL